MEFRVHYKGLIKVGKSADKKHKHKIRQYIHKQLIILAKEAPYEGLLKHYKPVKKIKKINFIPLFTNEMGTKVGLDILLLRTQIGGLLTQGSDVDNQLKTLFDGLKCPQDGEVDEDWIPEKDEEDGLYCLLEDDKLITRVSVETDRLLLPEKLKTEETEKSREFNEEREPKREVLVIMKFTIKLTNPTFDEIGYFS
jgi:hypothetical protein